MNVPSVTRPRADVFFRSLRVMGVALPFVVFVALIGILEPNFLSKTNFLQILRQATVPGLIAVGVTFVVISGRLDLSVGSLLSLTTVIVVDFHDIYGPGIAIAACLAVALVVGITNGVLVAYMKLNSLILTLAMLSLLQGLTMIYTGGKNVDILRPDDTWFSVIGKGSVMSVPIPVFIFAFLSFLAWLLLSRTRFGRYVYATGGNETAAAYSGVESRLVVVVCYVLSAISVAVAAIVLGSRVSGAQNNIGSGYELTVLAAIIIGGTSLLGGSGSILRTLVGVVLLGFVTNGLIFLGLPFYTQWLVTWFVLIIAVWIDVAGRRGRLLA